MLPVISQAKECIELINYIAKKILYFRPRHLDLPEQAISGLISKFLYYHQHHKVSLSSLLIVGCKIRSSVVALISNTSSGYVLKT